MTKLQAASKAASTKAKAAEPVVATASPAVVTPVLKKKELVDRVVERAGIKKKDAKPVVEAMLAELGEALARGDELNLQPLGKLKVQRETEQKNANVYVCKVRRPKSGAAVAEPLAKPDVDS